MSSPTPRRAFWLKTLHQWHWVSAALSLVGMLMFALTGLTLNHAGLIHAEPTVDTQQRVLPAPLHAALAASDVAPRAPLPEAVRRWLAKELSVRVDEDQEAEWSDDEVYLALPRPGGDAWLRIDRRGGELEYERTDRGWISYLNDLHKGRHTGLAWSWFIDVFALACAVFSFTGLFILYLHARSRPATWPLVAGGLVIPLLLAILFIH